MRKGFLILLFCLLAFSLKAQVSVIATPQGRLLAPTNFFDANRQLIDAAFSRFFIPTYYTNMLVFTNSIYKLTPTNGITLTTNGAEIIIGATGGGGGGTGSVSSVGIVSDTLTIAGSPITSSGNMTVNIPTATYPTRVDIASSNFVTAAITNGLAGTNQIYRILPGTNMVAVTNGYDVTLSSTASGSGTVVTNFDSLNVTNSIFTPMWGSNPRWNIMRASDNELYFDRHHSGGGNTRINIRDIPYTTTNRIMSLDATAKIISIFNSWTDASNFEEGFLRWETNTLKLGTVSAGTGANRWMMLGNMHPTNTSIITLGNDEIAFGTNRISFGYALRLSGIGSEPTLSLGGNYPTFRLGLNGFNIVNGSRTIMQTGPTLVGFNWGGGVVGIMRPGNNFSGRLVFGNPPVGPSGSVLIAGETNRMYITSFANHTNLDNAIVQLDVTNNIVWLGGQTTITNLVAETWAFAATVNNTASDTGSATNAMAGRISITSTTSSYVLTNSLVTADSVVLATVNSNDSGTHSVVAVPESGKITFYPKPAAPDGTIRVSWFIVKR